MLLFYQNKDFISYLFCWILSSKYRIAQCVEKSFSVHLTRNNLKYFSKWSQISYTFFWFTLKLWWFFWELINKSAIVSSVLILLIWQSRSSANPGNFIIITGLGFQNLTLHLVFWFTEIVIIPHLPFLLKVSIFSFTLISICDFLLLPK